MTALCKPASFATSVKCALNGRPEGAGLGCALISRVAIPCCWPSSRWADAHREKRRNERRVTTIGLRSMLKRHYGGQERPSKVFLTYFASSPDDTTSLYRL